MGSLALLFSGVPAHAQSAPPNNVEATSTPLIRPHGLAYDAAGNYYIADTDQNVIRKVSTTGIITTVAGTGEQGYAGDGGPATAAILDSPQGVAVDSNNNIYVADTQNNVIREVTASTGDISTIAGTGVAGYSGDGSTATSAILDYPTAVAVDSNGNVYIADTNNHRIREITGTTIHTVAGDGEQFFSGDGGLATAAGLDSPSGVAVDSSFNIYIGDTHNQRVRMVTYATGDISTIAGTGAEGYNGEGTATAVELARPRGVAVDNSGNVYFADSDNNMIRSIGGGNVTNIAGSGLEAFGGDGGAATSAWLDTPGAVAVSGSLLLFSDTENDVVRVLNGGTVNSTAGQSSSNESLVITGPTSITFGSGTLTATFSNGSNIGTGLVTFYDGEGASPAVIGSASLSGNTASVGTSSLSAGTHFIVASYAGDANNSAVASGVFALTVIVTPTFTWTPPSTIIVGSAGTNVLNASVNCISCGSIAYTATPAGGGTAAPITTTTGLAIGAYNIAAIFTPSSGVYNATSTTQPLTVSGESVWILDSAGGASELAGNGSAISSSAFAGANADVAIDSTGNVWTAGTGATLLEAVSQTGIAQHSVSSGGGLDAPSALAIDGASQVWVVNSSGSVSLFSNTGSPLSPSTGFTDSSLSTPSSIAVDLGGSVWIANKGNNSITRILGAAAPAAPPSTAAANNTTGVKP